MTIHVWETLKFANNKKIQKNCWLFLVVLTGGPPRISKLQTRMPYSKPTVNQSTRWFIINDKNCSLTVVLTAMDQKLQKS